jgi:hypothetical protein
MTAPSPELLTEMTRSVISLVDDVEKRYVALYESGYSRSTAVNRSSVKSRTLAGLDGLLASTSLARGKLDRCGKQTLAAVQAAQGALATLVELERALAEVPLPDRLTP